MIQSTPISANSATFEWDNSVSGNRKTAYAHSKTSAHAGVSADMTITYATGNRINTVITRSGIRPSSVYISEAVPSASLITHISSYHFFSNGFSKTLNRSYTN